MKRREESVALSHDFIVRSRKYGARHLQELEEEISNQVPRLLATPVNDEDGVHDEFGLLTYELALRCLAEPSTRSLRAVGEAARRHDDGYKLSWSINKFAPMLAGDLSTAPELLRFPPIVGMLKMMTAEEFASTHRQAEPIDEAQLETIRTVFRATCTSEAEQDAFHTAVRFFISSVLDKPSSLLVGQTPYDLEESFKSAVHHTLKDREEEIPVMCARFSSMLWRSLGFTGPPPETSSAAPPEITGKGCAVKLTNACKLSNDAAQKWRTRVDSYVEIGMISTELAQRMQCIKTHPYYNRDCFYDEALYTAWVAAQEVEVQSLITLHSKGKSAPKKRNLRGVLKCNVMEGRDLAKPAIHDGSGLVEAYCIFSVDTQIFRTSTSPETLSPSWRVQGDFDIYALNSVLHVEVWNRDSRSEAAMKLIRLHTLKHGNWLGQVDVDISSLASGKVVDQWYPLQQGAHTGPVRGQVRLQLQLKRKLTTPQYQADHTRHYTTLMRVLLHDDMCKSTVEGTGTLSRASGAILEEYALRYGVNTGFRDVSYLRALVDALPSYSIDYQVLLSALGAVTQSLHHWQLTIHDIRLFVETSRRLLAELVSRARKYRLCFRLNLPRFGFTAVTGTIALLRAALQRCDEFVPTFDFSKVFLEEANRAYDLAQQLCTPSDAGGSFAALAGLAEFCRLDVVDHACYYDSMLQSLLPDVYVVEVLVTTYRERLLSDLVAALQAVDCENPDVLAYVFDVYPELVSLDNTFADYLGPKYERLPVSSLMVTHVLSWIDEQAKRTCHLAQRAVAKDEEEKWTAVPGSKVRHSSSVVDVFSACSPIVQFVQNLSWSSTSTSLEVIMSAVVDAVCKVAAEYGVLVRSLLEKSAQKYLDHHKVVDRHHRLTAEGDLHPMAILTSEYRPFCVQLNCLVASRVQLLLQMKKIEDHLGGKAYSHQMIADTFLELSTSLWTTVGTFVRCVGASLCLILSRAEALTRSDSGFMSRFHRRRGSKPVKPTTVAEQASLLGQYVDDILYEISSLCYESSVRRITFSLWDFLVEELHDMILPGTHYAAGQENKKGCSKMRSDAAITLLDAVATVFLAEGSPVDDARIAADQASLREVIEMSNMSAGEIASACSKQHSRKLRAKRMACRVLSIRSDKASKRFVAAHMEHSARTLQRRWRQKMEP